MHYSSLLKTFEEAISIFELIDLAIRLQKKTKMKAKDKKSVKVY